MPLPVWYSKSFDTSVDGENISHMSVVEPEPRGVHQDCPIVGVITREEILNLLLKTIEAHFVNRPMQYTANFTAL